MRGDSREQIGKGKGGPSANGTWPGKTASEGLKAAAVIGNRRLMMMKMNGWVDGHGRMDR